MVNTITFGNVTSSTYDIYISGEGVWSAPERATEVIAIPGRNGAFIQDKGRYENITVTYPAFIVKDNNTDFKTKIDAFRNAMCAQIGYQKLTDTFHADEYRMAALIGGMEVEPILYNDHAATFDLVFECKPQRFLTSGETAVSVANNGTLTNPTLFDAHPLIAAKGYGTLGFNGHTIKVESEPYGEVTLLSQEERSDGLFPLGAANIANTGDVISVTASTSSVYALPSSCRITGVTCTSAATRGDEYYMDVTSSREEFGIIYNNATFSKKSSGSATTVTDTAVFSITYEKNSTTYTATLNYSSLIIYEPAYDRLDVHDQITVTGSDAFTQRTHVYQVHRASVDSTKSVLGEPIYIDCDLGEAYKIENGEYISLDAHIDLGSELPSLAPGSNTVTYDNTYTEIKMTPRWWKV